jgi:hypothetical protein
MEETLDLDQVSAGIPQKAVVDVVRRVHAGGLLKGKSPFSKVVIPPVDLRGNNSQNHRARAWIGRSRGAIIAQAKAKVTAGTGLVDETAPLVELEWKPHVFLIKAIGLLEVTGVQERDL